MFVCCLLTQNFHAGSVGRKNIFCCMSQKKTLLLLGKTVINRNNLFPSKWPIQKILGSGQNGGSVGNQQTNSF